MMYAIYVLQISYSVIRRWMNIFLVQAKYMRTPKTWTATTVQKAAEYPKYSAITPPRTMPNPMPKSQLVSRVELAVPRSLWCATEIIMFWKAGHKCPLPRPTNMAVA